jgi:hypothetical protein
LVLVSNLISQLTYERKSFPKIRKGFRRTLLRAFAAIAVLLISTLVWRYMGWRTAGEAPFSLPRSESVILAIRDSSLRSE